MNIEKMREEFEVWVKSKWPETDFGQFNDGEYCGFTLQHCWAAWQASREALVIELPKCEVDVDSDEDYEVYEQQECLAMCESHTLTRCRKAIEAAGLKVKP